VLLIFSIIFLGYGFVFYVLGIGIPGATNFGLTLDTEVLTIFSDLSFYEALFKQTTPFGRTILVIFLFLIPLLIINFLILWSLRLSSKWMASGGSEGFFGGCTKPW